MNLELHAREGEAQRERIESQAANITALMRLIEIDAENIRSLARIAQAHENGLDRIDGGAA